jgi:predicted ester cyclase
MIEHTSGPGHKRFVMQALSAIAEAAPHTLTDRLAAAYHPDAEWRGSYPMNEMTGLADIEARVWRPLLQSFPDLERRDVLVAAGHWQNADFVATVGHYCGTFRQDWLGIPANFRPITLRYGEVHRIEDGRIRQSTVLIDVLDVIRQAGIWPIAPSLGVEMPWQGPIGAGGISFDVPDPAISAASLAQTLAMHKTLGDYDDHQNAGRQGLLDMDQKLHWHPKMMWYGPCGIGTTRGLDGFVDDHQLPFRNAFPNRTGGLHYIRIGDGALSVTGGWPSVRASHLGGNFCGTGPTGREVTMRVMDFYFHHEGLIRENWVPIDIIDLLRQMDVDVFGRMRHLLRGRI